MEKKNNISFVGIMLLLYITLWSCNNNAVILYGGYGLLMFLTLSKLFFSEKGAVIEIYTPTKQLFIFMCFCAFSIFWSINQELAFQKLIFIFACVMLVIVMTNYFIRVKSVDALLFTVAVMGIVMAVYVIIFEGGISGFYAKATSSIGQASLSRSRVGGDLKNQNFIGIQCAYSAVALFYYAIMEKKLICYFALIIPSSVAIASGSRTGVIILFLGFLFVIYYQQKKQKNIQKYLKILFGTIAAVFLLRLLLSLDFMYTISRRMELFIGGLFSDNTQADNSTQIRLEMIKLGLQQFVNAPALGLGLCNSYILYGNKLSFFTYAHNDYIEHLVNGGLIGFLLYYRMFWYFIKNYRILMKSDNDPKVVFSYVSILLMLISNLANVSYYNSLTTYLFFILWTSQIEIKKKEGLLE